MIGFPAILAAAGVGLALYLGFASVPVAFLQVCLQAAGATVAIGYSVISTVISRLDKSIETADALRGNRPLTVRREILGWQRRVVDGWIVLLFASAIAVAAVFLVKQPTLADYQRLVGSIGIVAVTIACGVLAGIMRVFRNELKFREVVLREIEVERNRRTMLQELGSPTLREFSESDDNRLLTRTRSA